MKTALTESSPRGLFWFRWTKSLKKSVDLSLCKAYEKNFVLRNHSVTSGHMTQISSCKRFAASGYACMNPIAHTQFFIFFSKLSLLHTHLYSECFLLENSCCPMTRGKRGRTIWPAGSIACASLRREGGVPQEVELLWWRDTWLEKERDVRKNV